MQAHVDLLLVRPEISAALPLPSPVLERRFGVSNLETAAKTIEHAVEHLFHDRLGKGRTLTEADRDAIKLLCVTGCDIAARERRTALKEHAAAWLPKHMIARARAEARYQSGTIS